MSKKDDIPYDVLQQKWNALAKKHGLSTIRAVTEARRVHVRKRWKEWTQLDPGGPMAFFDAVLAAIPKGPWLLGKNSRGWKVEFMWLFANDYQAVKIMEGKYERDTQTPAPKGGTPYDPWIQQRMKEQPKPQ